ncbi:TRAP transporter small permease [Janthinobacterium fluminis]|uniref:TRAP transporter small permease protein n=1 Tax=Janthinobacterium fluminis TaxID=2987524 RepID=A0ABT5K129_9BURK|nr:TRAP transporter small permease [Janthinobacterium fluminis]MDC8758113.1 TRAP transporter small permease [Janthinobacterium fluminis]
MSHALDLAAPTRAPAPAAGLLGLAVRALDAVNRAILALSMLAMLAAAVILTTSVFLRYYLHAPTDWQDEAAVFLLVGATFLCAAHVQQHRGHVGIESLAGMLPAWANRLRRIFCDAASCLFCSFFAWKAWQMLHEAVVDGQTSASAWAPPLAIPYSTMAVGVTLLALQLLVQTLQHFQAAAEAA